MVMIKVKSWPAELKAHCIEVPRQTSQRNGSADRGLTRSVARLAGWYDRGTPLDAEAPNRYDPSALMIFFDLEFSYEL